jgi:hypothetical protein
MVDGERDTCLALDCLMTGHEAFGGPKNSLERQNVSFWTLEANVTPKKGFTSCIFYFEVVKAHL